MFQSVRGRATDRKMRLFACACCRAVWHWLDDDRSRRAVEVAELFADGAATPAQLTAAWSDAADAAWGRDLRKAATLAAMAAADAADNVLDFRPPPTRRFGTAARTALLRCVFGSPFRPPPAVDPRWLSWNGGTVAKMAAAVYEQRRFADLPILADALEDAGWTDAAILAHCRAPGEHVRGCWVVDLLTGRQ
jgi:hypothetical protein